MRRQRGHAEWIISILAAALDEGAATLRAAAVLRDKLGVAAGMEHTPARQTNPRLAHQRPLQTNWPLRRPGAGALAFHTGR